MELITIKEISSLIKKSKTRIQEFVNETEYEFPRPISFRGKARVFDKHEVLKWFDDFLDKRRIKRAEKPIKRSSKRMFKSIEEEVEFKKTKKERDDAAYFKMIMMQITLLENYIENDPRETLVWEKNIAPSMCRLG